MCSWPRADLGSGPTRSIPIRSKGTSIIGSGISGVGGGVRGAVRWHTGHAWQNLLTSASSPGQWKRSRIRLVVFWAPRWPAIGWEWASSMIASVFVRGTTKSFTSSPLRCATQYSKPFWTMKWGVGWGGGWVSFPSITLTCVQQCFSRSSPSCSFANDPPPLTCWNTSKKRLEDWEGDSPSRALSVASRAGRRWGRRLALLFRRFPAGLAGWRTAAYSWSNPGQSRPSSTGTGRSSTMPTSMGQVPGLAEMLTHLAGTSRVSPWTQVMGRRDLVPTFGGRTAGWTRLTALPESRKGPVRTSIHLDLGLQALRW